MQIVVLLLFLGVMWFVLIRPQQKQQKQHQEMLSRLQVGDDVVTIGGLHGRVVELSGEGEEPTVDLMVTDDVVLRFRKSSVREVLGDEPDEDAGDAAAVDETATDA